jgi:hypothetical protein
VSDTIGVIGDIHGQIAAVTHLTKLASSRVDRLIFVGDYVNRGKRSAEVIDYLVDFQSAGTQCVFLAGNHDIAFQASLNGSFDEFLHMGGAATVQSYVLPPYTDVEEQFIRAVPPSHRRFLTSLETEFSTDDLFVGHTPSASNIGDRFGVYGHVPQQDDVPTIRADSAWIDTGCGISPNGKLTCFFWPSRTWIQTAA